MAVLPPAPTDDVRFDALIAAVVDELLSRDGLPRPGWLDELWRRLDVHWDVEPVVALREEARAPTPAADWFTWHSQGLQPSVAGEDMFTP